MRVVMEGCSCSSPMRGCHQPRSLMRRSVLAMVRNRSDSGRRIQLWNREKPVNCGVGVKVSFIASSLPNNSRLRWSKLGCASKTDEAVAGSIWT